MSNNNNGYNHQTIHHHFQPKTIFLPIFCRLSLKDINQNNTRNRIPTDEPSSPKVTCIGQVKRTNRVTGFPTTALVETNHHKHTKLRKIFSSKALLPPATNTTTRNGRRNNKNRLRSKNDQVECVKVVLNFGEMDPPLPVVKKVGIGRDEVNIWKRRFHGTRLEGLQIEKTHVMSCKVDQLPPTV